VKSLLLGSICIRNEAAWQTKQQCFKSVIRQADKVVGAGTQLAELILFCIVPVSMTVDLISTTPRPITKHAKQQQLDMPYCKFARSLPVMEARGSRMIAPAVSEDVSYASKAVKMTD
jgi:hypothetical protein